MFNWKTFLLPLISLLFSSVGWFSKDIQLNGVTSATEPMLVGGLTIGGVWVLFTAMATSYKKAGGKLDGKLTPEEASALIKPLLEQFLPSVAGGSDTIGKAISPGLNKLIAPVAPSAVRLIDDISKWFSDPTSDPNETTLNHKLLDILSVAVKDDEEGSKAAATLRSRLHEVAHSAAVDSVVVA